MGVYKTSASYIVTDSDERLGEGGRGEVFSVLGDRLTDDQGEEHKIACKLFADGYRSTGRRRKIERLVELGKRSHVQASWPVELVFDDGAWAGYTMRRAEGATLDELCSFDAIDLAKRVDLAARACGIVSDMHELGVVVGDVGMGNFMYDARSDQLTLIDIDSVQVVDEERMEVFPVAESLEKSPEMLESELGDKVLTSKSDDFLAAVMVFRMLFGAHPLDSFERDASPAQVRADNARNRRFPYAGLRGVLPATAFGETLGELFKRSFTGSYQDVPKARDYERALGHVAREGFATCDACELEYARAVGACPNCYGAHASSGRVNVVFLVFLVVWCWFTASALGLGVAEFGDAALEALWDMVEAAGEMAVGAVDVVDGVFGGAADFVVELVESALG